MNAEYEKEKAFVLKEGSNESHIYESKKCQSDEEKVFEYAFSHDVITRNDVIELLGVSTSTASRVIRRMVKNKLLKQNGKARRTNYTIFKE